MMNDDRLDKYMRAFRAETDRPPGPALTERIMAVPGGLYAPQNGVMFGFLWGFFDSILPRTLGWALTCCLGIYLGLSAGDTDVEYFLYDQAQVTLWEDINGEGPNE